MKNVVNRKILNEIIAIFLCIFIIYASIIIGTPIKNNTMILTKSATIALIIYLILYKIILKQKYKEILRSISIMDACVLIICLSSFIPVIFKTYINYDESLNFAMRYVTILEIYILAKILIMQDSKYKRDICNSIIFTGIITSFIGIDNFTTNYFGDILKKVGLPRFINIDQRMFGGFGYANAFAMSLTLPFLLCMDRYIKKQKFSMAYIGMSFIFMSCIILSYSRATYVIIFFALVVYAILIKNKKSNLELLNAFIVLFVCALAYSHIFTNYYKISYYVIFIVLVLLMWISILSIILTNKILDKIKIKKYLIFIVIVCVSIVVLFVIGLNLERPLEIFRNITWASRTIQYYIKKAEPNEEYYFEADIESVSLNDEKIYQIYILEKDELDEIITAHLIEFGTTNEKKKLTFTTTERTRYIFMEMRSIDARKQQGVLMKNVSFNGKEYPLDYLYLPGKQVNRIKSLQFTLNNIKERGRVMFYKDAIKIIKLNPWTGIGGNGWKYKYKEIQTEKYATTEVHSYPLQIFLEYGIIAIIAYVVLVIVIVAKFKKCKSEDLGIYIAILSILLHSMIDFELSFMNLLLYTYVLIGIISGKNQNDEINISK